MLLLRPVSDRWMPRGSGPRPRRSGDGRVRARGVVMVIRDEGRGDVGAKQVQQLGVVGVHAVGILHGELGDHLAVLERLDDLEPERLVPHLPEHPRPGFDQLR